MNEMLKMRPSAMTQPSDRLPPIFFERLLKVVDPHQPPVPSDLGFWQRQCGRWLALRRMQLGISSALASARAGVQPESLLLLEVGLADSNLGSADWGKYPALLADDRYSAERISSIMAVALGCNLPNLAGVTTQVEQDLKVWLQDDRSPPPPAVQTMQRVPLPAAPPVAQSPQPLSSSTSPLVAGTPVAALHPARHINKLLCWIYSIISSALALTALFCALTTEWCGYGMVSIGIRSVLLAHSWLGVVHAEPSLMSVRMAGVALLQRIVTCA